MCGGRMSRFFVPDAYWIHRWFVLYCCTCMELLDCCILLIAHPDYYGTLVTASRQTVLADEAGLKQRTNGLITGRSVAFAVVVTTRDAFASLLLVFLWWW